MVRTFHLSRQGKTYGISGFTLLELLVVMVIMALLIAVVPPLVSGVIPGAELKASARQLLAGLRLARSQAITQNREVAFELDVQQRRYRLAGLSREYQLPAGLGIKLYAARSEFSDEHTGAIRFFPDGSSTGGRITVSSGERTYYVEVNWLTGQIAVNE